MWLKSAVLAAALTIGALTAAGRSQHAESCADLTRQYPAAPCAIKFDGFRLNDPRLEAIEASGAEGSGLFPGRRHRVADARQFNALSGKLAPGDQVILAEGTWSDSTLRLDAQGSEARPILIAAETPGETVLTGTSSALFSGSNLIIRGLTFRDGLVARDGHTVLRLGNSAREPCHGCIVDLVTIDNVNAAPERRGQYKSYYLIFFGRDITIANSVFRGKRDPGTMVYQAGACALVAPAAAECLQGLLFVDNVLADFEVAAPEGKDDGAFKLVQLGSSEVAAYSAFSTLIGNTFEKANGTNSLVSIKQSDVIIRGNTFRDYRGTLNLRSANRVLVEDNVFDGSAESGMGGVRMEGSGHWIVHNRFKNLVDPYNDYFAPVALHTAAQENLTNNMQDYARAKDIVIAGNRFDGVEFPAIYMGIFPRPKIGRTLNPDDVYILGNSFDAKGDAAACALADPIRYIEEAARQADIVAKNNRRCGP
jgi:poly(beta-D-mannuronate) lyase